MSAFKPPAAQVLDLEGAAILATYTASDAQQFDRYGRVRFWLVATLASGSSITGCTVKLQTRFNNVAVQTPYMDLPSLLEDVQGSAQPKGQTREIEHALTSLTAPGVYSLPFVLDHAEGLSDITVNVKADHAGVAGDSLKVYTSVAW